MTDTADRNEFNKRVIAEFRQNGGTVGGGHEHVPMILVHHTGAKSGIERIAPLAYFADGDRLFVFASKGGSDQHPAWYHNLLAHPETKVELGTDTFDVVAKVITGPERDDIYARHSAILPNFAEYQRKTSRLIPVVELERVTAV